MSLKFLFFDRSTIKIEEIESEIDDVDNFGLNFTLSGGITLSKINGGNSFLNRTSKVEYLGPDHVQVFWKHKCFENISQLENRPLIG